jgi:hypothetical protein
MKTENKRTTTFKLPESFLEIVKKIAAEEYTTNTAVVIKSVLEYNKRKNEQDNK